MKKGTPEERHNKAKMLRHRRKINQEFFEMLSKLHVPTATPCTFAKRWNDYLKRRQEKYGSQT